MMICCALLCILLSSAFAEEDTQARPSSLELIYSLDGDSGPSEPSIFSFEEDHGQEELAVSLDEDHGQAEPVFSYGSYKGLISQHPDVVAALQQASRLATNDYQPRLPIRQPTLLAANGLQQRYPPNGYQPNYINRPPPRYTSSSYQQIRPILPPFRSGPAIPYLVDGSQLHEDSCRSWCRTPENVAYCCEEGEDTESLVGEDKPGYCPVVRPTCPQIQQRSAPPRKCSNDLSCLGDDKCCYDRCLHRHACKPPRY